MDFNLSGRSTGLSGRCRGRVQRRGGGDRRIDVRVLPRDEAFALPDIIRTATNLVPPEVKDVRIIDIVGLDQQADGGTHVASTRQVGRIEVVRDREQGGKGFRRLRIPRRGRVTTPAEHCAPASPQGQEQQRDRDRDQHGGGGPDQGEHAGLAAAAVLAPAAG